MSTCVSVLAPAHRLTDLAAHLPSDWRIVHGDADGAHIVIMDEPGPRAVTAACLRHPAAAVIAVLGPYSSHEEVVDALDAGADACVRTHNAAIIAAHAEACRRRFDYLGV